MAESVDPKSLLLKLWGVQIANGDQPGLYLPGAAKIGAKIDRVSGTEQSSKFDGNA